MLKIRFAACLTAASLLLCASMPPAHAALPPPKPKEDVTKLDKPTIAYATPEGYEIRLMDWDGGNDRLWMGDGKAKFSGSAYWSPDGKRAAVVVFDKDEWSYIPYLLDLRTGDVQNLLEWLPKGEEGFFTHPSWSPDGKWVTIINTWYNQSALIRTNLYKVNIYTRKYVQLTDFPEREPGSDILSWSPDGQKIAFDALEEPMLANDANVKYDIYVMNSDGSNIVNITDDPRTDVYPSWSPDGRKIMFGSLRDDPLNLALYMMNSDGSGVERFMEDGSYISQAAWSPDSKWIVYFGGSIDPKNPKPLGVYLAHVATRKEKLIKPGGDSPTWVLAGKSRFLSVDPSGKKHEQWGNIKEADAEASQENASEE
ncbi:MAG: hypothetical protein OXT69_11935 [Candidatus Poribacteria bacterium]|nr:hypothetical protein [Candidatus Poribacteria bacterium]